MKTKSESNKKALYKMTRTLILFIIVKIYALNKGFFTSVVFNRVKSGKKAFTNKKDFPVRNKVLTNISSFSDIENNSDIYYDEDWLSLQKPFEEENNRKKEIIEERNKIIYKMQHSILTIIIRALLNSTVINF